MTRKNAAHEATDAAVEPVIRKTEEIMAAPTVGRIVHYRLTEANAAFADAQAGRRNVLAAGDTYPAIVTKVHGADCADLRIFIGAQDAFQSSVMLGDKEGMWAWPPRA
jgi:hypothetical protein